MSNPLEKLLAEKKEAIDAATDALERGAEALASAVGELFPLCQVAAPVLRLVLDNVQSKEVFYVKEQFLTVRNHLELLSEGLEDIDREIKKAGVDARYFAVEENIRNQFRKFMDVVEAKPQFREVKTKLFLEHFSRSGGEKNLLALYDGLLGNIGFGESILELVERYVCRSRRRLEDFCARMKELLCLGLIALIGHTALTQNQEEEQEKIQDWSRKMEEIELRMKTTIQSCVDAFPEQAKADAQLLLREKQIEDLQETGREILDFLVKKYDWVSWSVRLVNHAGSTYRNWRAGERFHHLAGRNCFEILQVNNISAVVSFSTEPRKVPRDAVVEAMEGAARRGNAPAVVEVLEKEMSGFLVHAVSRHKESAAVWSFPEDCHYWERHKNVAVCVHSD